MAEARAILRTPAWGLSVPGDCGTDVGPAGLGGPPLEASSPRALPLLASARKRGPLAVPAQPRLPFPALPSLCIRAHIFTRFQSVLLNKLIPHQIMRGGTMHLFQDLICRVGLATSDVLGINLRSLLTRSPARPSVIAHVMGRKWGLGSRPCLHSQGRGPRGDGTRGGSPHFHHHDGVRAD